MKKISLSLCVFLIYYGNTFCQLPKFKKKQVDIQLGVGFLSTLGNMTDDGLGLDSKLTRPPITLTADFGVTNEVSIGGYIATAKSEMYYQDFAQRVKVADFNHFLIGVRGLYHFDVSPKFDTYIGAMIGFNAYKIHSDLDDSDARPNTLTYNLTLGGRYHFTDHAGVFLELGYGVSVVSLGAAFKFNR